MTTDESIELLGSLKDPRQFLKIMDLSDPEPAGRYRHWNRLLHLKPPSGLTAEQWWAGIKLKRNILARELGELEDLDGAPFRYVRVDGLLQRLHLLDQWMGGTAEVASDAPWGSIQKERFIARNLIEEAIASSQLEGAATTRKRAKEMLRLRQEPATPAERMILNNYRAIQQVVDVAADPLTPELICELHKTLTAGTLDDPDAEGRFQTPDEERVVVGDAATDQTLYVPPPAEEIPDLIDKLCRFANAGRGDGPWVHPLVHAVVLHLMLGWIHPFEDSNGRAARALFYWSALRSDYWLMQYVSISRILVSAPGKYAESYLLTETDDNDATYFLLYQLDVIERAVRELFEYATRQADQSRRLRSMLPELKLNHRQEALLTHSLHNPTTMYTFYSHSRSHRVSHVTARKDILSLVDLDLLVEAGKIGRALAFMPSSDLDSRIEALATWQNRDTCRDTIRLSPPGQNEPTDTDDPHEQWDNDS